MDYPDSELEFYLHDNNEDAIDIIYDKYKYTAINSKFIYGRRNRISNVRGF